MRNVEPFDVHRGDGQCVSVLDEVLLEVEHPAVGDGHLGGDGIIGDGEKSNGDVERCGERCGCRGQGGTSSAKFGPEEVRGEVEVSKGEPRCTAELSEALHRPPGLSNDAPARLGVVDASQGVGHRVEIRGDHEPMEDQVITGVDDGGHRWWIDDSDESLEELRSADAATEGHEHAGILPVHQPEPPKRRC